MRARVPPVLLAPVLPPIPSLCFLCASVWPQVGTHPCHREVEKVEEGAAAPPPVEEPAPEEPPAVVEEAPPAEPEEKVRPRGSVASLLSRAAVLPCSLQVPCTVVTSPARAAGDVTGGV